MAGTTSKQTSLAGNTSNGAATPDLDGPGAANRGARLEALLQQVRSQASRVASPAQSLLVEVDGVTMARAEVAACHKQARVFELPADARSLTLRDENGNARAHLLLDDPSATDGRESYDDGRVELAIERDSQTTRLVLSCPDSNHATT